MVVAILLVASLFFILRPAPEEVVAVSADGLVRLEGVSRSSIEIQIERLDGVGTSFVDIMGPVYEITLSDSGMFQDMELEFLLSHLTDDSLRIQDVVIYYFNRSTLEWEPLPTAFDLSEEMLTTTITLSGSTLVGLAGRVQHE